MRSHFLVLVVTILMSQMTSAALTADDEIRSVGQSVPLIVEPTLRLDVGISVKTEVRNKSGTDMEAAFRETEALLIGQRLRGEFERNDHWGVVRLFPEASVIPQLSVQLSILASDGRELVIEATARAVSGETIVSAIYRDISVDEDYTNEKSDPFADLYATVVNDIADSLLSVSNSGIVFTNAVIITLCERIGSRSVSQLFRPRGGPLQCST